MKLIFKKCKFWREIFRIRELLDFPFIKRDLSKVQVEPYVRAKAVLFNALFIYPMDSVRQGLISYSIHLPVQYPLVYGQNAPESLPRALHVKRHRQGEIKREKMRGKSLRLGEDKTENPSLNHPFPVLLPCSPFPRLTPPFLSRKPTSQWSIRRGTHLFCLSDFVGDRSAGIQCALNSEAFEFRYFKGEEWHRKVLPSSAV